MTNALSDKCIRKKDRFRWNFNNKFQRLCVNRKKKLYLVKFCCAVPSQIIVTLMGYVTFPDVFFLIKLLIHFMTFIPSNFHASITTWDEGTASCIDYSLKPHKIWWCFIVVVFLHAIRRLIVGDKNADSCALRDIILRVNYGVSERVI